MSDYDFQPGGSLKLKGGVIGGGVTKKKKKKSKVKDELSSKEQDLNSLQDLSSIPNEKEQGSFSSDRNSPPSSAVSSSAPMTKAEKGFNEGRRRRLPKEVKKIARMSHKERVDRFNTHLESLSEHHDIPKVGPG